MGENLVKEEPELSIIVPVYNVEKYLPKCIESILNQTIKNFELLLINDGSTDGSGEICERYAQSDYRIKVIHQNNGGLSNARNKGISRARGKWIGFIDSDDYIHREMYQILYDMVTREKAEIGVCELEKIYETNKVKKDYKHTYKITKMQKEEVLLKINREPFLWDVACNKLYAKRLFEEIKYPEGMIFEDMDISHRLFYSAEGISYTDKVLYYYVQREGSILNASFNIKRLDRLKALQHRIQFARQIGFKVFQQETEKIYADSVCSSYFKIKKYIHRPNQHINKIRKDYLIHLPRLLSNPLFSVKHKVALVLFAISPQVYEKMSIKVHKVEV